MNESNLKPDPRLSELLNAARPTTPVSPSFQDTVWRRIERLEQDESAGSSNWLARLATLILQPRTAGALALAMVLIGAGIGAAKGNHAAREAAQARYLSYVAPAPVR